MARKCTIPAIFGLREWFESRFGDLCAAHDESYIAQEGGELARFRADYALAKGMWQRGYWWLALPTQVLLSTVGWYWWWFKE